MQLDRNGDQPMTECFEHSPIASLVGIGQGGARYPAANPDVVELGVLRVQTSHQIAQALASGELGIGDAEKMVPSREMLDTVVGSESIDQVLEVTEWNKTQQLRENRLAAIHGVASFAKKTGNDTGQKPLAISNRRNQESRQNPRHCGQIDQDRLARSFGRHFSIGRGYGPMMRELLPALDSGGSWRELAPAAFDGHGSFGNGSAMRVAPLGAYFADKHGRCGRERTAIF